MLTEVGMKGVAVVLSWCLPALLDSKAGELGVGSRGPAGGMASRRLTVCIVSPMGLVG